MSLDPALIDYVETEILPRYAAFDGAHGPDHVRMVIRRSLELARRYPLDLEMVYVIAAWHDLGLSAGREHHHLVSGELLAADRRLRERFTAEQLLTMREAVEDHRASSDHAPRSIYGRIVAEADRCIDPELTVRRTVRYGLDRFPGLDREAQFVRCRDHLLRKYAGGGYLRLWILESDNVRQLEALRRLLADPRAFRALFDRIYDRERAGSLAPAE